VYLILHGQLEALTFGRFEKEPFSKASINVEDPEAASISASVVFSLLHGRKWLEYFQGHLKP
jgi:hypothetical protein